MAVKKRKVGRPKMPNALKKVGFTIKVRPILFEAIEKKTKNKNRNQEIETILENNFLKEIHAQSE